MTLSEELQWRGFVNQTTLDDVAKLDEKPISFYFGVDPSAKSMTIGNLAAAMMVRHFIAAGHKAYLLVGGATGYIGGDPDGKKVARDLKTIDEVEANKRGLARQYQTLFSDMPFEVVDNYEWFKGISYLDFLRNVGTRIPLSQMLGREFVQSRIGEGGAGISYAEFSYALIQGYDFLHLFREHGVTLQLCGADQWGNSIAGVDIIRRLEGGEAHIYSTPLVINKSTGVKFGKSEGGAIWLDPELTSVYKFYQFWLNVDDIGVIDYMKIYTLLPQDEIAKIAKEQEENPGARVAQRRLAHEVTTLVHGTDRCASVERVTAVLFGGESFDSLDESDIKALSGEIPSAPLGVTIVQALAQSGAAKSNGEARRLMASGAVTVNGEKAAEDRVVSAPSLVKKGKNSFVLVCDL